MLKKIFCLFVLFIVIPALARERAYDNVLFVNSRMDGNYFYSKTLYTAPSWIKNSRNKLPVNKDIFYTPGNSLQLNYVNGKAGTWSAEISKPNWRGQDIIKEGQVLSFSINISAGTGITDLPAIQIRGKDSGASKPLSLAPYLAVVQHGKWKKVLIPLRDFKKITLKTSDDVNGIIFLKIMQTAKSIQYMQMI